MGAASMFAQGWPANYEGVMLQGFYWDSYRASKWQNLEAQADDLAPYFSLIWVPQSANCSSERSMGYDDLYWFSNYNSSFGNEAELRSMISTFKSKGIGTIADVMRMEGENRTIVSCGLAALNHTDFVGIHALLKEAGLLGKPITSIQIGFVLSPRINAAGRMGAADLAADLLQETDPVKAEELAKQLCDLNR